MKCSLMGRCASFNFLPVIWEWSKDQKLPRQEGNKCRGIWNSQNLGGIPVFFFLGITEELHIFPWIKKKNLKCNFEMPKKIWSVTLRYQKTLKYDFEIPKKSEMWLWDASTKSQQYFVSCICWITLFEPKFCGVLWKGLEWARAAGNDPLHPNNPLGCYFAGFAIIVQFPSSPKLPGCVCEEFYWVIMKDSAFQSIWDSLWPTSVPAVSSVGMSKIPQRSLKAPTAFFCHAQE